MANSLLLNVVCIDTTLAKAEPSIEFSVHQPMPPKDNELSKENEMEETGAEENADVANGKEEIKQNHIVEFEDKAPEPSDTEIKIQSERGSEDNHTEATATKILKGQLTYTVPSGTPVKLKLAMVPSHPMGLANRDFDGNLYPARLGQQITAKTTEDIYVDHNKIIPEGTIFYGEVTKIFPPRRVGRPGSLALSFYQLTTPNGCKFAFRAEADNFKKSTAKSKAKGFGIIAAHAAGGAIVGALVAYQLFGMQNTIAMHGYNIAGGAAGGALLATGYAIMRKGPKATLEPGDDLNMAIDSDLLMPIAREPEIKKNKLEIADLKIEIEKSKIVSDGLGSHFVTIDAMVVNESDADLSSIDLFLQDSNGDKHPLCSSPEEDSQFLFHIEPHSQKHLHLSFLTPYPKLKQQLVWLDHETKLALARQRIE